jgi:hypothetical protein
VTKQFLGRLQVHACRTKVRRKRVTEAVPSDHLVLDASAFERWPDRLLQHMSGVTGFLPFNRMEGNTKSLSAA